MGADQSLEFDASVDASLDPSNPNNRVHHHAQNADVTTASGGLIETLCGLLLPGRRPDASTLPCCPMCAAEMESVGERCR